MFMQGLLDYILLIEFLVVVLALVLLFLPWRIRNFLADIQPKYQTVVIVIAKVSIFFVVTLIASKLIGASFLGVYEVVFGEEKTKAGGILFFFYSYSWIAYLIMGLYWIFNKKTARVIPVTGTVCGVVGVLTTFIAIWPIMFYGPACVLACFLVKYHLNKDAETLV